MDGNRIVAKLLAENVHADTSALAEDVVSDLGKLPEKSSSLPVEDFGIWIDPIGEIVLLELDQFAEFLLLRNENLYLFTIDFIKIISRKRP